jgi:hypothetical protein
MGDPVLRQEVQPDTTRMTVVLSTFVPCEIEVHSARII